MNFAVQFKRSPARISRRDIFLRAWPALPWLRRPRSPWLCLILLLLLTGCGTTQTYQPNLAAGPARPADYPIPLFPVGMPVPRPCDLIGQFTIGDTEFTLSGGSFKGVMKTLMATAHEKGADAVQLVVLEKPDFSSAHYRLQANLLRYASAWEKVALSENDFLAYLQQHRQTLDPIEGVWDDGSPERICIIKDAAKPGRDFIAFIPNPGLASWRKGYKKMDIARLNRPDAYHLKYYRDDFAVVNTGLLLDRNRNLTFNLPSGDGEYPVTFVKIFTPAPAN